MAPAEMLAVGSNKKPASRMRASEQIVFVTGQVKDTTNQAVNHLLRTEFPKVHLLLDCVPFLTFSVVGRRNICRRFNISEQTLDGCLNAYLRPGEAETEQARRDEDLQRVLKATPELLDTIGKAVKHTTRPRQKTTTKGQKGGKSRGK